MVKSRFLAFVLRHKPEVLQLELNSEGYVSVDRLIENWNANDPNRTITVSEIKDIVKFDNKQRYNLTVINDELMIRANQGHSISVNLTFDEPPAPQHLYHGSVHSKVESILKLGLLPMERQYVHLSSELRTAELVGLRRIGELVLFQIDAKRMQDDGFSLYLSDNGVWLAELVPKEYLTLLEQS